MSKIVELSSEQELALERNLVWLFASPRSGTTWTSVQLLSHKTKLMGEPLIGSHLADARELGNSYIRRYEEQAEREPYFFSSQYKDVWQHYVRKLILHRIYAQFQDLSSTIIIKEPNGSMAADLITDCLPQSKILILLRDGRDVINSLITALSKGGYAEKNSRGAFQPLAGARRRTSILLNSRRWAKLVEVLLGTYEKHDENLRYLIRYEQLLENTYEQVQKLYDFLGINISEAKLGSIIYNSSVNNIPAEKKGIGTTIQFAKAGVWQERFNDEEKAIIQEIIGDGLKKLGYYI